MTTVFWLGRRASEVKEVTTSMTLPMRSTERRRVIFMAYRTLISPALGARVFYGFRATFL
jgi:hypothetical protein